MAATAGEEGGPWRHATIEERRFGAALITLAAHWSQQPVLGPLTMAKTVEALASTLEKTRTVKDVREALSRNPDIWVLLRRTVGQALCYMNEIALGERSKFFVPTKFLNVSPESVIDLITKNHAALKEMLPVVNKVMIIASHLLVTSEPEVPQDLAAAIGFDHEVYESIYLCVNINNKAIDGVKPQDEGTHSKLKEINTHCKRLLMTSLQYAHNWINKNERNKMSLWYRVTVDYSHIQERQEVLPQDRHEMVKDWLSPRIMTLSEQILDWQKRNSSMCSAAKAICEQYFGRQVPTECEGSDTFWLRDDGILAWNYTPTATGPHLAEGEEDKDKSRGRVSCELDEWWELTRMPTGADWSLHMMPTEEVENQVKKVEEQVEAEASLPPLDEDDGLDDQDSTECLKDEGEEFADEEGLLDLAGLLTDLPNLLKPKEVEPLFMIVRSCILQSAGGGVGPRGENLQQTRCRMMLATDSGRNLLRELLHYVTLWEKGEDTLIFELCCQIVEALHESSLIPFAWHAVSDGKEIMNTAQTTLLKVISHLSYTVFSPSGDYNYKARRTRPDEQPSEDLRLAKMVNYLYAIFRGRILPHCLAFMGIQASFRKQNLLTPMHFPIYCDQMEKAHEALRAALEWLEALADLPPLRQHLVEFDAVYDLTRLLDGIDAAVEKVPFPALSPHPGANGDPAPHPLPGSGEPAPGYPWSGVKAQCLSILAALLQPPAGQTSPGNPIVQKQIVQHNGIISLLNCCVYDDNSRFCRERVQLCLKWLMDGSPEAGLFLQNLVIPSPGPMPQPPSGPLQFTQSVDVDHVAEQVSVQARSASAPAPASALNMSPAEARARSEDLVNDIIALTDQTAKLSLSIETDDTEEEDSFM